MLKCRIEKKDGVHTWTIDNIKVEFSDSHIQAFNGETILTDTSRIMYLYYNVAVYHATDCDDDDNDEVEWTLLFEKYVHDFPALLSLIEMLNACLNKNKNNLSSKNRLFEDFYELSHCQVGDNTRYTLVIGGTPGAEYNGISHSVALEYLSKEEVMSFSEFVNGFMADAIERYNKRQAAFENFHRTNKVVRNNRLYVYENDFADSTHLDKVLVIGDEVELVVFASNPISPGFIEEEICDVVVIEEFDEENQTVTCDGFIYPISDIAYIFMETPTSKLNYSVDEIVPDFIGIMTETEKEEFKRESVDCLFDKYKWMIISRTWMCRGEHEFEKKYPELLAINDTGNHERVFEVVRMVIREIKKML